MGNAHRLHLGERGHEEDVAEAIALLQTELMNRRDAKTLHLLAWAFSEAERWQKAQQTIQEAIGQGVQDAASTAQVQSRRLWTIRNRPMTTSNEPSQPTQLLMLKLRNDWVGLRLIKNRLLFVLGSWFLANSG